MIRIASQINTGYARALYDTTMFMNAVCCASVRWETIRNWLYEMLTMLPRILGTNPNSANHRKGCSRIACGPRPAGANCLTAAQCSRQPSSACAKSSAVA